MNVEKIRKDFPVFETGAVYMDSACVSLKPKQVVEAMNRYYYEFPGCAGRSMHKIGNKVTESIAASRKTLAKFFGTKPQNIIFTRNTTEGINLVANSLGLKKGDKVVTTDKEHNSNLLPWQRLAKQGIKHEIVKGNLDNTFNLDEFQDKVKGAKLVSMVHTSNLDGVTNPVKEIIKIAHENGALVMIDGAQGAPHKDINLKKLDVDFFACSGHKMLGPSGIGMLYGKQELLEKIDPFLIGGDTVSESTYTTAEFEKPPEKFEAGLQNYAGMIGFAEAAKYLDKIGMKNIAKHEIKLNKKVTEAFLDMGIKIIGPEDPSLRSGIISFLMKGKDPHEIALMLDSSANIMTRSGAHCVHSWFNAHNMVGTTRASLYLYNNEEDCDKLIEEIKKIAKF